MVLFGPIAAASARNQAAVEVSVSAANYEEFDRVARAVNSPRRTNPPNPAGARREPPRHYVFAFGEKFETDAAFGRVCAALETALEKKGFLNAADAAGRVAHIDRVELVLRVSYGDRTWRMPAVRLRELAWRDGVAHSRPSAFMGGAQVWDRRAGGDDRSQALAMKLLARGDRIEAKINETLALSDGLNEGMTREQHLLVVDAFDYRELLAKGARAQRRWSTLVAIPQQRRESFADVLATLVRVATPYFGETTEGIQVFNDARATIDLGTPKVVESDVSPRLD